MMGLYLYCVGDADHPEPGDMVGIEGSAVYAVDTAGLRAWVSNLPAAPSASLDRVRSHNAVVESSSEERTALPMRFGQWFSSETELHEAIAARRVRLERSLERVRGALEFGVRVLDPERSAMDPSDPVAGPTDRPADRSSGKAYLESLARREEGVEKSRLRGAEIAAELRSFLGPLVRDHRVRPGGREGIVAISHLVARHDTGAYAHRVHTFTDRRSELRFVTSGPWPPYGFADDGT